MFAQNYGKFEFEVLMQSKPDHLTPSQYNIMILLFFNEGKTLSSLADCLHLSLPNASREIRQLSKLGYIEKIQDQSDKRKYIMTLTQEASDFMSICSKAVEETFQARTKHLSVDEIDDMIKAFLLLSEKLK